MKENKRKHYVMIKKCYMKRNNNKSNKTKKGHSIYLYEYFGEQFQRIVKLSRVKLKLLFLNFVHLSGCLTYFQHQVNGKNFFFYVPRTQQKKELIS